MKTESIIAIALLVILVAVTGVVITVSFIMKAKRQTDLLMPMIEDYLAIMCKLDNVDQSYQLDTIAFCIKIFKDAYSDLTDYNTHLEEMNQLYKVKELELIYRKAQ